MSFFVFCMIPLAISYMYAHVYCETRKVSLMESDRKIIFGKALICLGLNFLLMNITGKFQKNSCMLLLLLEILSGIDIFILRIPTELLVAAALISGCLMFRIPLPVFPFVTSIFIGAVFRIFRDRIGIGSYDILLMVLLGAMLPDVVTQVKYIAVILILWGILGIAVRALKSKRDIMIPLVPLITFSYYAVRTLL